VKLNGTCGGALRFDFNLPDGDGKLLLTIGDL